MAKTDKYVETVVPGDVLVSTETAQAVQPVNTGAGIVYGNTAPVIPIHIQIEEDGIALLKKLKAANVDFEIFLRGIYQRLENGLI